MTGLGSSCGACKFLRRRCTSECVFAPYFSYDEATTHFAAVHRVFGASNVSKLLSHLPIIDRGEAATSISYEALARMQDPVYGCVAHIIGLQQQVATLQEEIVILENQMASLGVDGSSHGSSQLATNNFNYELQICSQQSDMNAAEGCLSRQEATLFSHAGDNISGDQDLYTQMNIQLPNVVGLQDQTSTPYSSSSLLERLYGGMNPGISESYLGIHNGSNVY
ncbi:LOB domain-containing protein 33-like [Rhododendron vialii]|uniref:LOB domain-containing protein 33-like n=1 Tax=Rhododendron vialii TaxID=182163 RepID=UPI0026605210|nr:LOB domain-containing protein 33-like [Rhododendron vialii]